MQFEQERRMIVEVYSHVEKLQCKSEKQRAGRQ